MARISDAITSQVRSSNFLIRSIFFLCYHLKRFLIEREISTLIPDLIAFRQVQNTLGGCCQQFVIGGSSVPKELHVRLETIIGIPIRAGYGLSEGGSGNVLTPCNLNQTRPGTSGYPLSNVEIRIVPIDEFPEPGVGEILMGGSGLCSGYLNDPEGTAALFTDESHTWIHTGDIGKFDEVNSLVVVDRLRSVFKLTQGEYVASDLLAQKYELADLVSQIFVYGDSSRDRLVAVVVPAFDRVKDFVNNPNLSLEEFKNICEQNTLKNAIQKQLEQIHKDQKFLGFHRITDLRCDWDQWTIENGLLSPTLKAKRKPLTTKYQKLIDEMYK